MNEDGSMARLDDLKTFGEKHNIRIVAVADLIRWRLRNEVLVNQEVDAEIKIGELGKFRVRVFKSLTDNRVHMVMSMGELAGDEPILARVQAASHAIDVFGFSTSDSNLQLEESLKRIAKEGRGVLLYLNIAGQDPSETLRQLRMHLGDISVKGLGNSMGDGYLREMGTGAHILVSLGVQKLRLMTNNPRKIVGLEGFGLEVVERVPILAPISDENRAYLTAKRLQLGHLLSTDLK
jgi:3,4-dihydroxy 2-butanone 4-phosphate synthase/GTP cyclohydrolase II